MCIKYSNAVEQLKDDVGIISEHIGCTCLWTAANTLMGTVTVINMCQVSLEIPEVKPSILEPLHECVEI